MDKKFIVDRVERLDKFLSQNLEETRNQIESLIKKGFVKVDDQNIIKTGYKLKEDQEVSVTFPQVEQSKPKDIDFNVETIYEDEHILIINKPSNLVVHDAPSVNEATLVDWLKHNNISLSTISGEERHGIVHRLDKGTSGLMVVAKTNEAHLKLSEQLQDKSMGRYYLALIDLPLKDNMCIEKPIGRNPKNRLQQAVVANGRDAKSKFLKISNSKKDKYELIACKLFTGRTHQIRVHLNSINRHIIGDTLYGFKGSLDNISRFYLHAYLLYLVHPITQETVYFKAKLPDDMQDFINTNFEDLGAIDDKIRQDKLIASFDNPEYWL